MPSKARTPRVSALTHTRRPATPQQRLLTIPQAAAELGIQEITLWHWIYKRQIESVKVGRARRVPRSAIDRIIDGGYVAADKRVAIA